MQQRVCLCGFFQESDGNKYGQSRCERKTGDYKVSKMNSQERLRVCVMMHGTHAESILISTIFRLM